MAYLPFTEPGVAAPAACMAPRAATRLAELTPLEWSVVALAWGDKPSSLRKPGRVARALAAVFGGNASHALADPKLEALRRMSIQSWRHGYAVPPHEVRAFHEAGWSAEQYELLVDSIAAHQARERADVRRG